MIHGSAEVPVPPCLVGLGAFTAKVVTASAASPMRLAALAKSEKRAEELLRQAAAALENAPKPGLICPFPWQLIGRPKSTTTVRRRRTMHAIAGEYQNLDAMGLASGKGMRTTCDISEQVEGKTYCFGDENSKAQFMKDPAGNRAKAEAYYRLPPRRYLAVAAQRCQLQQHRHCGESQRVAARSAAMLIVFATTKRQTGTSTTGSG
jgi:YHS domain-containing protein